MFTRDSFLTMSDGSKQPIGPMADIPAGASLMVRTKGLPDEAVFSSEPGEYVEIATIGRMKIKCGRRVRLCLAGGGYVYAEQASNALLESENGPQAVSFANLTGKTEELVTVRVTNNHAIQVNGFWVLVD